MAYTAKLLICDVLTAGKEDTVLAAALKMRRAKTTSIVVVDGRKPVGIFSERDLLNRVVAEGLDPAKTPLAQVMTPSPEMVDSSKPLDIVFSLLADGRFRHIPITEDGLLVGMVTLSDLAKVLREVYMDDKYLQYFVDCIQRTSAAQEKRAS
ncbi:MAG: CBS domain-containing protein [Elusimicrobiota bacterium]